MVKKLMKYEFMYYLRSIAPMCIILLGMALANRLIQFAEKDRFFASHGDYQIRDYTYYNEHQRLPYFSLNAFSSASASS